LVAYALTAPGNNAEIGDFLRSKLPAYMVPTGVVCLETWPLTANGKIDRKALPAPELRRAAPGQPALHSPAEETVARIFGMVLGREVSSAEDNFFELGGHSLLAAQAVTHLNVAYPNAVSIRMLFDHPTVATLAREVVRRLATSANPRPAIQ